MSGDALPKLDAGDLAAALAHAALEDAAAACVAGCDTASAALERLEGAGFLMEAARLVAYGLPRREAVWWACQCAVHTAPAALPAADRRAHGLAEQWVRRPNDDTRRQAMKSAEEAGFRTPEAWAAVAAFWSGDSMAPPEAPKVPPAPHLAGAAAAGSVLLAAVRGRPERQKQRLARFLAAARDIAAGGPGRIEPEPIGAGQEEG